MQEDFSVKPNKARLDQLILDLGYFDTREKVRSAIMQGLVKLAGKKIDKAGFQVNLKTFYEKLEAEPNYLEIDDKLQRYVSRGAFKLEAAYKAFGLNFKDVIVLDVGASTGGFTDFSLQHGAKQVIALDVGKAQLHYKLQQDDRVLNLEGINFRNFRPEDFRSYCSEKIDFIVSDLSFISITKLTKNFIDIASLFNPRPRIILLLKPQFEASKEIVDKCKGIIRDDRQRKEIMDNLITKLESQGLILKELLQSPIKGGKGNIEYISEFIIQENQ